MKSLTYEVYKPGKTINIVEPTKEKLKEKLEEYYIKYGKGYKIFTSNLVEKTPDGQYSLKIQIREVVKKTAKPLIDTKRENKTEQSR